MVIRCRYCEKEAVVRVPYAKLRLCAEHFMEFVESRVRDTIERYRMIGRGDTVVIALSGGKDSSALAQILSRLSSSIGFKLLGLHIDLGIGDFSKRSRVAVENLCKKLGIECVVVDLEKDLGFTLPEFASRLRTHRVCSLCGIVKRYIMNAAAIELGVGLVATAHHADDMVKYIVKNFILQDYDALKKLRPVNRGVPGVVATRIKPMFEVYEKEAELYTSYAGLDYIAAECPYKGRTPMESAIEVFIDELEHGIPSIKISLLRKFASAQGVEPQEQRDIGRCRLCGLASRVDECAFCRLTQKAFGSPLGTRAREVIRSKIGEISNDRGCLGPKTATDIIFRNADT